LFNNKAGTQPLEVKIPDFVFSKFKETNDIDQRPRLDAVAAIIGADIDIVQFCDNIVPSFKLV
jgi:hypothetical protein